MCGRLDASQGGTHSKVLPCLAQINSCWACRGRDVKLPVQMLPSVESSDRGRWVWVNAGPLTLHHVQVHAGVAERLQVSEAGSPGTAGNALSTVAGGGVCGIVLV